MTNRQWIDPKMIHPWQEIDDQKITVERSVNQSGYPSGSYEGYVNDQYSKSIMAKDIDTKNPIFYVNKTYNGWAATSYEQMKKENPKYTFVMLAGNRVSKFQRDFPQAQEINEYVRNLGKTWADSLTHTQKLWLKVHKEFSDFKYLKDLPLDDPALKKAVKLATTLDAKLLQQYQRFGQHLDLTKVKWTNPLDKYPLWTNLSLYGTINQMMKDHISLYFNAAYAAERKGA